MADLILTGISRSFDGTYELPLTSESPMTNREYGWVGDLCGIMPLDVEDAFFGGHAKLFATLAGIALYRSGKIDQRSVPDVVDQILDAPYGAGVKVLSGKAEGEEEEPGPPQSSSSSNGDTSGLSSTESSGESQETREPSGTPGSGSSASPLTRSAT